jgi:hypothetical protein
MKVNRKRKKKRKADRKPQATTASTTTKQHPSFNPKLVGVGYMDPFPMIMYYHCYYHCLKKMLPYLYYEN